MNTVEEELAALSARITTLTPADQLRLVAGILDAMRSEKNVERVRSMVTMSQAILGRISGELSVIDWATTAVQP